MHPFLRPSTIAPASVLLLLTVLFTVAPRSVDAQPPTPNQSADDDFDLSGYKYFGIAIGLFSAQRTLWQLLMNLTAALVGFGLLCCCCNLLSSTAAARKTPVRDLERQPAAPSSPTQGQGAAPAFPPKAHTKEDALSVCATNDEEPGPPPYYPVSRL